MPTDQFDFSENPFADVRDPRSVYPSRSHLEAVAHLRRTIDGGEPFALLTGLPGTGKTTAVAAALAAAGPHAQVTIAASPSLAREEFLARVVAGLAPEGADPACRGEGLETRLRAIAAAGRAAVLVVEDAHELGPALLDDLRLYSNPEADGRPLLRIVLVGRRDLETTLSGPACETLRRRIGVGCRLAPMSAAETDGYVQHRLAAAGAAGRARFGADTCAALHRLTHGIPREIDRLATEALSLAGTAGEERITPGNIDFAVIMLGFRSVAGDSESAAGAATEAVPELEPAGAPPLAAEGPPPATRGSEPAAKLEPEPLAELAPEPVAEPEPEPAAELAPAPAAELAPAPAAELAPAPAAELAPAPAAPAMGAAAPPAVEVAVTPSAAEIDVTPVYARAGGPPPVAEVDVTPRPAARGSHRGPRHPRTARVPKAATWAAVALVVVASALVVVGTGRKLSRPEPAAALEPAPPAAPAPREPAANVAQAEALPARAPVPPRPRPAATTWPTPVAAEPPSPPAKARPYGVEVATFLSESRALAERDRLAAALPLPCRVVGSDEDGYAVVVGPVKGADEATRLGADLAQQGLVSQARIVRWKAGEGR